MTTHSPRIAFLTGRSDPERCALSPTQRSTLDDLATHATGIELGRNNFPWDERSAAWRPVPLFSASIANARQYLAARRGHVVGLSPETVERARAHLIVAPRTLLLVGSCGLILLDALIAPFDASQRARLRAVAFGGVAPRWPQDIVGTQLRGERDRIAAWLGPHDGPPIRTVAHGHMDYLDSDVVVRAAREHLPWLRG